MESEFSFFLYVAKCYEEQNGIIVLLPVKQTRVYRLC